VARLLDGLVDGALGPDLVDVVLAGIRARARAKVKG